jgi:hypothetical protein
VNRGAFIKGYLSNSTSVFLKDAAYEELPVAERPLLEPEKTSLPPGIYMGSKPVQLLGKLTNIYRHQFLVMIPKNPEQFKGRIMDLGNGVKGFTIGGYGIAPGRGKQFWKFLKYHVRPRTNYAQDKHIVRNFLEEGATRQGEISKIDLRGMETDEAIQRVIRVADTYRKNERKNPQYYPGPFTNALGLGRNSNTFAQSLAAAAGLKKRRFDFSGWDAGSKLRFPEWMFRDTNTEEQDSDKMNKQAYLDGYLSKVAEKGPAGGTLMAANVGEKQRQVLLDKKTNRVFNEALRKALKSWKAPVVKSVPGILEK